MLTSGFLLLVLCTTMIAMVSSEKSNFWQLMKEKKETMMGLSENSPSVGTLAFCMCLYFCFLLPQ
jgi:hypothetical protein